jgi:hypothetical protein
MNRSVLLAILPLALAGCAVPPMHVDVPDIARSEAVTVRDVRPPTEARSEALSLLITSDAYGLFRLGDVNTEPSLMRLVRHRVYERMGAGAHVTVNHLVMYRNLQPQLKASAWGALLGPIGAGIAAARYNGTTGTSVTPVDRAQFEALAGENEWKRALVGPAENPKKVPVDVTYLDLDVDGRRAFVRVISPEQADDGRNPFLRAAETTIGAALDQLSGPANASPVAASPAPTIATPAAVTSTTPPTTGTTATVAAEPPVVTVTSTSATTSTTVTVPAGAPAPAPLPAPAPAPLPAPKLAPAPPARAPLPAPAPTTVVSTAKPATSPALPVHHLDGRTVDGAEWVFPALNPLFYRDVTLAFRGGRVDARNQGESTSGTYTVADDKVCVAFESERWGQSCYVVLERTAGVGAHGLEIMELPSGVTGPLTIR